MTGVKARPIAIGTSEQLNRAGVGTALWAGLQGMTADKPIFRHTTTVMAWASLATRTSEVTVPFNYTLIGIHSVLTTAPVSTGKKRFQVGTSTSASKYLVTGNVVFVSGDTITTTNKAKNYSSATNIATRTGLAGEKLRVTLPPLAAVATVGGAVQFHLLYVPR